MGETVSLKLLFTMLGEAHAENAQLKKRGDECHADLVGYINVAAGLKRQTDDLAELLEAVSFRPATNNSSNVVFSAIAYMKSTKGGTHG